MTRFTEEQAAAIVERYRQGEGLKDLSAAMHTSDRQIKQVLTAAGVPLRVRSKDIAEDVLRLYRQGWSQRQIALELHVNPRRVSQTITDAGLVARPQHSPKFTADIEREITRRHAARESTKALAQEYGCCTVTIQAVVRRNGGKTHDRGNRYRDFTTVEIAEMTQLWQDGESQTAIAQRFGAGQATISRVLRQHGAAKEHRQAMGDRHGKWKGGRIDVNGYVMVRMSPDHPFAAMRLRNGYVMEHRLIMAESIGRPLSSHEYVHHIDGDRGHNDLENLQLMSASHTKGQAMCCADCGSRNLVPCPIPSD